MLVLTRKVGERIAIGDDIEIVVTGTSKGAVKLGIDAPRSTPVVRGELKTKTEPRAAEAALEFATP